MIDRKPHQHSEADLQLLRDLAQCVEQEFRQLRVSRAARTLGEHGSYLRAVLETVVDGIITIDQRGIMQTVNPAAERIFDYGAAEVLGRNVSMLMPEPYAEISARARISSSTSGGIVCGFSTTMRQMRPRLSW